MNLYVRLPGPFAVGGRVTPTGREIKEFEEAADAGWGVLWFVLMCLLCSATVLLTTVPYLLYRLITLPAQHRKGLAQGLMDAAKVGIVLGLIGFAGGVLYYLSFFVWAAWSSGGCLGVVFLIVVLLVGVSSGNTRRRY